jgi:two-component sensor histidine kinase
MSEAPGGETAIARDWSPGVSGDGDARSRPPLDEIAETPVVAVTRTFPPVTESVRNARLFAEECSADLHPRLKSVLVLLVSELATNCVKHTATDFEVSIDLYQSRAKVRVSDSDPAPPVLRDPAPTDLSGRGLRVVQQLSDDWGVDPSLNGHGKTVWFSMNLT